MTTLQNKIYGSYYKLRIYVLKPEGHFEKRVLVWTLAKNLPSIFFTLQMYSERSGCL